MGGMWSAGTCTDWTAGRDCTDPDPEATPEVEPEVDWLRVPVAAPALAAAAAWLRVPAATPVALSLVDMFGQVDSRAGGRRVQKEQ